MEKTIGALIHNRFDFVVTDATTGEIKQKASAYNIILNTMWSQLCNGRGIFSKICLGSGTGTLDPARTSLFNMFCSKDATAVTSVVAYPTSYSKKSIQLSASEYVGTTITEVGIISNYSYSDYLVTHALLQDSEGNPISIVKTATDIVTIYATIFGTVTTPTGMDLIGLAGNNEILKAICSNGLTSLNVYVGPSDAPSMPNQVSTTGYSLGSVNLTVNTTKDIANKKVTSNVGRIDVNYGNGDICEIVYGSIARMILPSDACPAKAYTGVALGTGDGTKKDFIVPSKNIQTSSLVVYKNAVVQALNTDYTIQTFSRINFLLTRLLYAPDSYSYHFNILKNAFGFIAAINNRAIYGKPSDGNFSTLDSITNFPYVNQNSGLALSPVEMLIAVPHGKSIDFMTVVNDKFVASPVTIDTPFTSNNVYNVCFSPDGQHLAAMTYGEPIRVYKKDGNVFKRLTTGFPTVQGPGYNWAANAGQQSLFYSGDNLVCGVYYTGLCILHRVGDVYTKATVTGTTSTGPFGTMADNADGSKIFWCGGSGVGTTASVIACFSVDASGNITLGANIPVVGLPTSTAIVNGISRIDDTTYMITDSVDIGIATCTFDGTSFIVTDYWADADTNYRIASINTSCQPCKLSDTITGIPCVLTQSGDQPHFFAMADTKARTTKVSMVNAPASAAALTVDYTVNGITKTVNYVLDFQISVQYGEGV